MVVKAGYTSTGSRMLVVVCLQEFCYYVICVSTVEVLKPSPRDMHRWCAQVIAVVCCRMGEMQSQLYRHFLESSAAKRLLAGSKASTRVLSAITSLKKLCNHPKLIYDAMNSKAGREAGAEGFEGCQRFFPPGVRACARGAGELRCWGSVRSVLLARVGCRGGPIEGCQRSFPPGVLARGKESCWGNMGGDFV